MPYFPKHPDGRDHEKLPDDELIDIINCAKPVKWQLSMLKANIDPYGLTWEDAIQYFERLELAAQLQEAQKEVATEMTA